MIDWQKFERIYLMAHFGVTIEMAQDLIVRFPSLAERDAAAAAAKRQSRQADAEAA